ncbi:hypothetical protein FJ651_08615 [Paucihalobacter ruber]|uniref:Prenyltransferase n=1 Tax=Paucihalobacter ruber TaxID=2567861 RepID=A0A506PKN6_9FLAO|nr:hypothetical protein [Paucihalobacter ruber]TPV34209.1 hypothetical protein FJ651_08615 [Paucihalobacter ruber]
MHNLKKWFEFYLNASVHVALAAVSLTLITAYEFAIKPDISLILFVFFATISAYNFVKYFGIDKAHFKVRTSNLNLIFWSSLCCVILAGYFMMFLKTEALAVIAVSGLITWFYAFPKSPFRLLSKDIRNLRMIPGLKVYLVALVWSLITFMLLLVENDVELLLLIWISFVQRFLILVVLILPFEIRDLQFDSLKLQTIPQKIGVKNTKLVGFIMILAIAILEYVKQQDATVYRLSLLTILIISAVFLFFSRKNSNQVYTGFWVESIPVIWLVLMLLFKFLLDG